MTKLNKFEVITDMNYNSISSEVEKLDWIFDKIPENFETASAETNRKKVIKFRLSVVYFVVLISSLLMLLMS